MYRESGPTEAENTGDLYAVTRDKRTRRIHEAAWEAVIEMIDASWELAERLGKHPLRKGCNCIECVNKRKRILAPQDREWTFRL